MLDDIGGRVLPDTPGTVRAIPSVASAPRGARARDCPLCGAGRAGARLNRCTDPHWPLVDCQACGLTYLAAALDYEALAGDAAWEKSRVVESERRDRAEPLLRRLDHATRWRLHLLPRTDMPQLLARHVRRGAVLDIGCGDGGQMAALREGLVPHGVEISPVLARRAEEAFRRKGGSVVCAPATVGLSTFPDAFFAAVTLRSYLEHEVAPAEILAETFRVLQPGGIALVKVPNYGSLNRMVRGRRWCGFRFPDHVNYFNRHTLRKIAEKAGFSVAMGLTDRFPLSDNLWARLVKPQGA